MMDEYVERLARVLEQDASLSPIPLAANFPRRRDRRLEIPELKLDMLDFLSLYGCDLQSVVGERNSVLGRVMQPINVLRYDLRFIAAAKSCLPELKDEKELYNTVAKARAFKVENLPIAVWNATWGTKDIETLFTRTKGTLPIVADDGATAQLSRDVALLNRRLASLRAGDLTIGLDFFGGVHQRWESQYRMGQLIKSTLLVVTRLNDAADLLERRLNERPLCLNQKTNNQAEIVKSMFFSIYAGKVQPYMARVEHVRRALVPGFSRLAKTQRQEMPDAFVSYYHRYLSEGRVSLWAALDKATARHTKLWQKLLGQCGMRPGQ